MIFSSKCTIKRLALMLSQNPLGELWLSSQRSPSPIAGFRRWGPGWGREGREMKGRKGIGRGRTSQLLQTGLVLPHFVYVVY